MPNNRFADMLARRNETKTYLDLLVRNFNPAATANVMCTSTVSVGWDGKLYDCDFNQQLGLSLGVPLAPTEPVKASATTAAAAADSQLVTGASVEPAASGTKLGGAASAARDVFELKSLSDLTRCAIATDAHCFGCTAGMGSSCQVRKPPGNRLCVFRSWVVDKFMVPNDDRLNLNPHFTDLVFVRVGCNRLSSSKVCLSDGKGHPFPEKFAKGLVSTQPSTSTHPQK